MNKHPEFNELYNFSKEELILRFKLFPTDYSNLKSMILTSNDQELISFLSNPTSIFHLSYKDNTFNYSYYTNETFDDAMKSYMNSLIMVMNNEEFHNSIVRPIILSSQFFPIQFNEYSENISLSNIQIKIYEILISYLSLSNSLFEFQKILDKKAELQMLNNKFNLFYFLFALVNSNVLVDIICGIFFWNFKTIMNNKFNLFLHTLEEDNHIEFLLKKFKLISDLSKLFSVSPFILVSKIVNSTKKAQNTCFTPTTKETPENKHTNQKKTI